MSAAELAQQDAMHALYRGHHSWLTGWLRRRLGCSAQAADLAQDTFVRVLAARNATRIAEPRAYLATVARGILVNWYRRQDLERAWLDAVALLPEASVPSPQERYLLLETLQRVDAMLDALPAPVRRAFLLSQLDGMGYDAIAIELGVSTVTIKRYMKQAFLHCLLLAGQDGA
ncbi:sigma-70 family RNA polymerase sigma factor [Massilia atriviolacea]|uniref:Sigma-70 family RNA polymerase sigma factor n=1 Tax=Massilia atriviolacea TaxID=2495579 RepID=A0A430HEK7_9BURK|nr:sigma-70 family RNA polymerase sigma factor [Massilia atriviolacea]RSZ55946.1 sigma-70 family RNA polymerase sigma factor [Massilia atriviolacea]